MSSIPGPKRARVYFARRRFIHQPAKLCLAEVRNQLKERGVDELRSQKRSGIRMVEDQTTQEKLARFVWLCRNRYVSPLIKTNREINENALCCVRMTKRGDSRNVWSKVLDQIFRFFKNVKVPFAKLIFSALNKCIYVRIVRNDLGIFLLWVSIVFRKWWYKSSRSTKEMFVQMIV